jgi:SAM-dependent methyltransferase
LESNPLKESLLPYQADGGKVYHDAIHGGLGRRGFDLVARRRAAKMQRHIRSTDRVLEYGVGTGWNLSELRAGARKGFDVAASLRSQVESLGIEFAGEITPVDSNAYDVVICSHVLEHLLNPAEGLSKIRTCLKPKGKALLFVPFDYERKFRKYNANEPNHHLYSWNTQSFTNLVLLHGFTVEECGLHPFGYERIVAKWVEKLKLPGWCFPLLLKFALFIRPSYEVAVVARKSESH